MYRKLQLRLLNNQTHVDHENVQHIDNSQILQTTVVSSSVDQHSSRCQDELERFLFTMSPLVRLQLRHAFHSCLDYSLNATDDAQLPDGHTQPQDKPQPNRKPTNRGFQRHLQYLVFQIYKSPFGRLYIESRVETKKRSKTRFGQTSHIEETYTRSRFSFAPATWLSYFGMAHAVDVAFAKTTTSGLRLSLRVSQLVPDDSHIFELCRLGDVNGVRELLYQGEASLLDINSRGTTPLHMSARYLHPDLCQFLISKGANVDALDFRNVSPFCEAAICFFDFKFKDDPSTGPRQIETFDSLVSGGVDLEFEQETHRLGIISRIGDTRVAREMRRSPMIDFQFPSQWIFKQLLPSILADPFKYDQEFWVDVLSDTLRFTPGTTLAGEILPYCEPQVVRIALLRWCEDL